MAAIIGSGDYYRFSDHQSTGSTASSVPSASLKPHFSSIFLSDDTSKKSEEMLKTLVSYLSIPETAMFASVHSSVARLFKSFQALLEFHLNSKRDLRANELDVLVKKKEIFIKFMESQRSSPCLEIDIQKTSYSLVSRFKNLTFLNIIGTRVLRGACWRRVDLLFQELGPLSNLTELHISKCMIYDTDIIEERRLYPSIRRLVLKECYVSSDLLTRCVNLEHLDSESLYMDPHLNDLRALASLTHLQYLSLVAYNRQEPVGTMCDDSLSLIAGFTKLRVLNLANRWEFTNKGLERLNPLIHLKYLNLQGCRKINGQGIANLNNHPNLRHLVLGRCGITGACIDSIVKTLPLLESLDLSSSEIGDKDLPVLTGLTNLKNLNLKGVEYVYLTGKGINIEVVGISDVGLAHIAAFSNLESLSVTRHHKEDGTYYITDEGMTSLKKSLPRLQLNVFPYSFLVAF